MTDTILAQIAALKAKSTADLRGMWLELFGKQPAFLGRRYLEDRLAYRVQELHFGSLSDRARRKLDALVDQLEPKAARRRDPGRPIAGTQLRREWKGIEHVVQFASMISSTMVVLTNHCRRLLEKSRTCVGMDGHSSG
jgi:Protein of unknown function (DUF2924)